MGRQLFGLREYARHREAHGLPGITLRAVQKAIESGRITTVVDEKGKPKIDAEVADIQWGRNTDPDQSARANAGRDVAPPPSGGHGAGIGAGDLNLAGERARLAKEQADRVAMQNAVTRGELAPVVLLEQVLAAAAGKVAGIFDAIPGLVRRRVPRLTREELDLIAAEIAKARNLVAAMSLADLNVAAESADVSTDSGDSEIDGGRDPDELVDTHSAAENPLEGGAGGA